MNETHWAILSEWHNAWLAADADERRRLREALGRDHPGLQDEADALAAASSGLQGFLDTPAFIAAAPLLAEESAPLKPGTTIGPYHVVDLIAHGGMGDVYRASDVRLGRHVAIKVLTQTGPDSQSVHRFVQEARVTASLDHPNIVKVFDVGMSQGKPYLVAELLEGETLGARVRRGALPIAEAMRITAEIASGLTAAHDAGLVHRDLKPDNIFLTRSGVTKILDFGIAKLAYEGVGGHGGRTLSGVLLGTAGYLAPEQVRGDPVDARADLFALGSIAFEMITGRRAFAGAHTIDTLHAIAHDPPPDLASFGDASSPFASTVIRLLQKDPDLRFQSAALLREALTDLTASSPSVVTPAWRRWSWPRSRSVARIALAITAAAALVGVGALIGSRDRPALAEEIPLTRMVWTLPAGMGLDSPPVVSPDGRRIVFVGVKDSSARLMVWRLDETSPRAIPGTAGAKQPFWSPAGDAIGFFARQKLMKVGLSGGVVELADAPDGRGGTWSSGGTILFSRDLIEAPIFRVSDRGGTAPPVTQIDFAQRDNSHRWPAFLPDGVHFLYFLRSEASSRRGVYVGRLDAPASQARSLLKSESEAVYVPDRSSNGTGHVLYVADGRLEARPFDAGRIALAGDARVLATPVAGNTPYHAAMFSASRNVLAFTSEPVPFGARLGSVGRNGDSLVMSERREIQGWPRLSADGKWLARQRIDDRDGNPDIWVDNLERGTHIRVTTDPHLDLMAVWSPDGRQLAYISDARGKAAISIAAADGTGVLRTIPCPGLTCETSDWSSDGTELIVTVRTASGFDVWAISTETNGSAHPILAETFDERDARISRHGWIAYVSNETGRNEVSVRSRRGDPRRTVVSSAGGTQPVWRRDGSELFFVDPTGRLSSVSVRPTSDGGAIFGMPIVLSVPLIGAGHWGTQYDVSPDGRRIHFMDRANQPPSPAINVVLGWRALLR